MRSILLLTILLNVGVQDALSCSMVHYDQSEMGLVSKSYDWPIGAGYALVNQRGVRKTALVFRSSEPAQWVSKYGSVTFNQFGQELPSGGMNEKGLVVALLWLSSSVHPQEFRGATVNEAQWVQYQLDNFSSVPEILANVDALTVEKIAAPVHYMACDKTGTCAVFEYINGALQVYHDAHLRLGQSAVHVLANSEYLTSKDQLSAYLDFGGLEEWPRDLRTLPRFLRGARRAHRFCETCVEPLPYVFNTLDIMRQDSTQWQIVYNTKEQKIKFRTKSAPTIKEVDLSWFDFSCQGATQGLNLDRNDIEGKVEKYFLPYTLEDNARLLDLARPSLPAEIPDRVVEAVSRYPQSLECAK